MHIKFDNGDFNEKYSTSFVCEFLKQIKYSLKAPETKPNIDEDIIISYCLAALELIVRYKLQPSSILNLDETGVNASTKVIKSYASQGKTPQLPRSSREKERFTLVALVSMLGEKLIPSFIFHGNAEKTQVETKEVPIDVNIDNLENDINLNTTEVRPVVYPQYQAKRAERKRCSKKKKNHQIHLQMITNHIVKANLTLSPSPH